MTNSKNIIFLLLLSLFSSYGNNNSKKPNYVDTNEFFYCDTNNDGIVNIEINQILNTIRSENIGLFNFQSSLYISTSQNRVHQVTNLTNQPQIQFNCIGSSSWGYTDIAISKDGNLYVCSGTLINEIDSITCAVINSYEFGALFYNPAMTSLSFDNLNNLYFSGSGFNSQVFKIANFDFSTPIMWHNFQDGKAGGDFVLNNGKMYIAWVKSGVDYLYEVVVDELNEYVSHTNLGILPQDTYGLASELGQLYGITKDRLFQINLSANTLATQTVLLNTANIESWYGLTGENEARTFITNAYISLSDAENKINPLPELWQNTIPGGQIIYVSILDTLSNQSHIFPVQITVNTPPVFNKIETLYNCENSLNPYEFNLESIANQIKIHSNDEVLFFSNSNDFLSNQNSVSGNFITQNKYTTLFVKVTDPITNCSDSFTIQLIVELAPLCSTISESKICIDNLNDFRLDIPLELFKEKFDYVIDETLYEVKIYNSLSNAENDLNPLENSLILTNNNYLQNVNLFFRIKNLISECITICPTNILLENYSQTNKKYEFEIKDFSSNNSIVVLVNNTDNLLFSIDGINFSPNNNFENLSPGPYNLTVKDFSVCEYSSQSLYVLNYPKFFTPNNDGFNDVWKVSFSHLEQDLKTEIYDRYGKLLKIMTSNESWDGNNNGFDLPSDDYWFYVIRNDSRIFKGHFTLRR